MSMSQNTRFFFDGFPKSFKYTFVSMGNWKGYGRVYHRNIGKVTKFGLFWIIIFRSNYHFSVGGRNPPSYRSRVNLLVVVQSKHSVVVAIEKETIIRFCYVSLGKIG